MTKKVTKKATFKPCGHCKTPAKCKKAGKCLMKSAQKMCSGGKKK